MTEETQGLMFETFLERFRWVALIVIGIWVNWPGSAERYNFELGTANTIWIAGTLLAIVFYFVAKEVAKNERKASSVYKLSIILDTIIISSIVIYASPAQNPFFGFYYLVVMRASVYWKQKGSILTALGITLIYLTGLMFNHLEIHETTYIDSLFKFVLLYSIGLLGGAIIENEHKEKQALAEKEQEISKLFEKFKSLVVSITEVSEGLEQHSKSIFQVSKDCDNLSLKIAQINNNVASESLVHNLNIKSLSGSIAKSNESIQELSKILGNIDKNSNTILKNADLSAKALAGEDIEELGKKLKLITTAVKKVIKDIGSIENIVKDVSQASDIVMKNSNEVLGLSEHITESVQEVAASSIEQSEIATNLVKLSQELHKLSEKRVILSQIIEDEV